MKEKVNPLHVTLLIYTIQSGVVILSLPRLLADHFGTNGWVFLFVLSFLVMMNIFLLSKVYQKGKGESVFTILSSRFPTWILAPLYLYIATIWALVACFVAKQFILIVLMISFPTTPPALFKGMAVLLAFLLLIKGIYNMVKAATMVFILTAWIFFLTAYHFGEFEWVRLSPFFLQGDTNMIAGSFEVYSAFLGYELCIFLFGYVDNHKGFFRAVYLGNLLTTLVYIFISIVSFGFFGLEYLKILLFPVLELLAYIELPFIERIENVVFNVFLGKVVITSAFYYYAAQQSMIQLFKKVKPSIVAFSIIVVTFIYSYTAQTLEEVNSLLNHFAYHAMGIAWGLPLVLLISLSLKKKGEVREKT